MPAASRINFCNSDVEGISIASVPLRRPREGEAKVQSEKVSLRNMRVQANDAVEAEAQTDDVVNLAMSMFGTKKDDNETAQMQKDGIPGFLERYEDNRKNVWFKNVEYDSPENIAGLGAFLKSVVKDMLSELEDGLFEESVTAFQHYEPQWETETDEETRLLYTLKQPVATSSLVLSNNPQEGGGVSGVGGASSSGAAEAEAAQRAEIQCQQQAAQEQFLQHVQTYQQQMYQQYQTNVAQYQQQGYTSEQIAQYQQQFQQTMQQYQQQMQYQHQQQLQQIAATVMASKPTKPAAEGMGTAAWSTMGATSKGTRHEDHSVLDIAWNCTGNVLAASYGKLTTLGWCEYTSQIAVWNIFKRSTNKEAESDHRQADVKIEVQGEVVALSFHPKLPNILAGGSYNGELILWDVSTGKEGDPQIAISNIDDYFHREAIHSLQWVEQDGKFLIATVSGDGKILIWDVSDNLDFPTRGFSLIAKKKSVGGRCLAFSPFDFTYFVLGSETGALMRGMCPQVVAGSSQINLSGPQAKLWKPNAIRLLDALPASSRLVVQNHVETFLSTKANGGGQAITAETIFKSKPDPTLLFPQPKTADLEPHNATVVSCKFSPFHRKMLLSAGMDGSVKLFDVLQQRPLYVFYPPLPENSGHGLADVSWSYARPLVFAVAPEKGGEIQIYDLMASKHEPSTVINFVQKGASKAVTERVTRVKFNPTQRGLLAAAGSGGEVKIYSLPWNLSCYPKTAETSMLNKIMK